MIGKTKKNIMTIPCSKPNKMPKSMSRMGLFDDAFNAISDDPTFRHRFRQWIGLVGKILTGNRCLNVGSSEIALKASSNNPILDMLFGILLGLLHGIVIIFFFGFPYHLCIVIFLYIYFFDYFWYYQKNIYIKIWLCIDDRENQKKILWLSHVVSPTRCRKACPGWDCSMMLSMQFPMIQRLGIGFVNGLV